MPEKENKKLKFVNTFFIIPWDVEFYCIWNGCSRINQFESLGDAVKSIADMIARKINDRLQREESVNFRKEDELNCQP